jgi:hypothetical protein
MENEIVKTEAGLVNYNSVEQFQMFLNKEPDKSEIDTNTRANNSKFIGIGVIERKLDEIFSGLWTCENFHWQVIANEVVGSIDLKYYHPTAKQWIIRTGAAAVQIQLKSKERGGSGDITEIKDKIVNTLQKDFPHLKAECLKNAAKGIGNYFGRNLNRDEMPDYEPLSDKIEAFEANTIDALSLLQTAKIDKGVKVTIEKQLRSAGPEKAKEILKYLEGKQ